MALARRRHKADPSVSSRWPKSFVNAERMQLLVASEEWRYLVEDLRSHYQEQCYRLVHEVAVTGEQIALQNFERGRLAGWEWILEFEQELKEWREQGK